VPGPSLGRPLDLDGNIDSIIASVIPPVCCGGWERQERWSPSATGGYRTRLIGSSDSSIAQLESLLIILGLDAFFEQNDCLILY